MGTFGWTMRGAPDPRDGDYYGTYDSSGEEGEETNAATAPRGGHFDPRNFTSLGPHVSVEVRVTGTLARGCIPSSHPRAKSACKA